MAIGTDTNAPGDVTPPASPASKMQGIVQSLRRIAQMTADYAAENPGKTGALLGGLGGVGAGYAIDGSAKGAAVGGAAGSLLGLSIGTNLPETPGERANRVATVMEEQEKEPSSALRNKLIAAGLLGGGYATAMTPPLIYATRKALAKTPTAALPVGTKISKLRVLLGNPSHVEALLRKFKTL